MEPGPPDLDYRVEELGDGRIRITQRGSKFDRTVADDGGLLLALEGDLVVQLQLLQSRRLFMHAAVVERSNAAHLLVGRSGAGKSTLCWGLLHSGFGYVSDELAPVDPETLHVAPYPHALCMKRRPPASHPLSNDVLVTSRGFHVPVTSMPQCSLGRDLPVRTILLVDYDPVRASAQLSPVDPAEAATRLYPNILNALAHEKAGLAAAARIAAHTRTFLLASAELDQTCELVAEAIGD